MLCGQYHVCFTEIHVACLRHLLFLSAVDITSQESKGLLEFFPLSYIIVHLISRAPSTKVLSPLQVCLFVVVYILLSC